MIDRIEKTDEEWKAQLTPEQYRITRLGGTERAFTGPHWDNKAPGIYACVNCGTPLFSSETKYDSGTGWPSFHAPLSDELIRMQEDRSLMMRRTEALCAVCDAHLGHVFPDGPPPTGLRFCLNGHALNFIPEGGETDRTS